MNRFHSHNGYEAQVPGTVEKNVKSVGCIRHRHSSTCQHERLIQWNNKMGPQDVTIGIYLLPIVRFIVLFQKHDC